MKTAEQIQARRATRMAKVYAKRGRTRAKPIGRYLEDPLRPGKQLFQVYGVANAAKLK